MAIEWSKLEAEDKYDLVGMSDRGDTIYNIAYLVNEEHRTCTAYVNYRDEDVRALPDEQGNFYYDIDKGRSLCNLHEGSLPKL